MCRWLAYEGPAIRLEDVLFRTQHSLIDQSLSSLSKETTTNGDGFGVGWYGDRTKPGLYRSVRPAWNDFNLHEVAAHTSSPLFLAHVRATSKATVQETNCHPFRYTIFPIGGFNPRQNKKFAFTWMVVFSAPKEGDQPWNANSGLDCMRW